MEKPPFKIIEKKNFLFAVSVLFIVAGFLPMMWRALNQTPILNFGIDFTGGTTMLIQCEELQNRFRVAQTDKQAITIRFIEELRELLRHFGLEKSSIQITQNEEVLIKTTPLDTDQRAALLKTIEKKWGKLELLELDSIGPSIGAELRQKAIWIVLIVFVALMLYITWRFEFVFGLGALISLVHDALAILSFASLFHMEVDTAFIAALLTVLGYSINDTIVVYDRIRENTKVMKKDISLTYLINASITQTFSRTINTSLTVLIVLVCLMVLGGTTIKPFATILFFGILIGTYSSIFIASPVVALFSKQEAPQ